MTRQKLKVSEYLSWVELTWNQAKQLIAIPLPYFDVKNDVYVEIGVDLTFMLPVSMREANVHRRNAERLWDPHYMSALNDMREQRANAYRVLSLVLPEEREAVRTAISTHYAKIIRNLEKEEEDEEKEENELKMTVPFMDRVKAYIQNAPDAESIDVLRAIPLDAESTQSLTIYNASEDTLDRAKAVFPTINDISFAVRMTLTCPGECDCEEKKVWKEISFMQRDQGLAETLARLHPAIERAYSGYQERLKHDEDRRHELNAQLQAAATQYKEQTAKIAPCDN